jgi:hypothetical protein
VEDPKITKSNTFADKVEIYLNMLGALVLDRVGGHVNSTDIVTVYQGSPVERRMKLTEELTQPRCLCHSICNSTVFRLGTGPRHGVLSFGGPRNKVVTKKNCIAGCGLASIGTTSPIGIRIDHQLMLCGGTKNQAEMESTTNISEDALEGGQMGFSRIMHVKTHLLDCISNIRTSEGQILKCSCQAPKISGVSNRITNDLGELWIGVNRGGARFAV